MPRQLKSICSLFIVGISTWVESVEGQKLHGDLESSKNITVRCFIHRWLMVRAAVISVVRMDFSLSRSKKHCRPR